MKQFLLKETCEILSQIHIGLHVRYRVLYEISMNLEFCGKFSKNTLISSFMKIHPMEVEVFHADGRTDGP
jgi:hypothetical protein